MNNTDLVNIVFFILHQLDVENIIVCAGARNAPLVVALDQQSYHVESYFEERSAAFYALGKIKSAKRPVAIITTSGTAAAELLPAVIEAYYQGLPLIVITADRPKNYRGTGAPQAIEQLNLYGNYVQKCCDWDINHIDFNFEFDTNKPLHLNICFDEPLIDQAQVNIKDLNIIISKVQTSVKSDEQFQVEKPLVILGQLDKSEKNKVKKILLEKKIPHYAEFLSGLLADPDLKPMQLNSSDLLFGQYFEKNIFKSVLRVGHVPTLRFWRDLEKKYKSIPVLNISNLPFTGLARNSKLFDFESLDKVFNFTNEISTPVLEINKKLEQEKYKVLNANPLSEQNLVFRLAQIIQNQPIYIGNSLPIREIDLVSDSVFSETYANRGANGIDGQISTYLGWSEGFKSSWALIGDLTAMYDLAALGLRSKNMGGSKKIIVMNNQGGQIFKKVFNHEKFLNTHSVQFRNWAQMWGWNYILVQSIADLNEVKSVAYLENNNYIIEVQPQQKQSDQVWAKLEEACQTQIGQT